MTSNDDLAWLEQESPAARAALLTEASRRVAGGRLELYEPYAKQRAFHAAGLTSRERALIAANQVGKTLAAGAEVAFHATGLYPSWWAGLRFDKPTRWTVGSESAELTRKGVQRILLGPPESESDWGTGMLPRDAIVTSDIARRPGVPDAVATIPVRHVSGGTSVIQLASYDQGRTKWQADTLDGVWFDEEPPEDVYTEGKTRTNVSMGPVLLTLTPLMGMSSVVHRFLIERPLGTHVTMMTLEDAEHYSVEQRKAIIASYPAHEREARTKGIPTQGSGRIYPLDENLIKVPAFQAPAFWPRLAAMDFGFEHPTAVVWVAWDRDSDIMYIIDCYRRAESLVPVHAATIKAKGAWIPMAWPHDGNNDTAAGPQLSKQYREAGVNMRLENAKFPVDPRNPAQSRISVEAGLSELLTRMETGRLKVFSHLNDWFEEFRLYHRKDGKVVKERDDLMSATRYALMDLRFAIIKPTQSNYAPARQPLDAEMGY